MLEFQNIEFDTLFMETRLPPNKLQKTIKLIKSAFQKTFFSRKTFDCLMNFLDFVAKMMVREKSFLRL